MTRSEVNENGKHYVTEPIRRFFIRQNTFANAFLNGKNISINCNKILDIYRSIIKAFNQLTTLF